MDDFTPYTMKWQYSNQRTQFLKDLELIILTIFKFYFMMYSVKSVRPVTGRDSGRSPSDGDTFPIGLLGTEKFSTATLVRTHLI